MLKKLVGSLLLLAATAPLAHAQVNAYSNITTFTGQGYASAGAATFATTDTLTTMAADDITVASGFGGRAVTLFTFSVANFNSTAVSARPLIQFFATNGTSGGPGTLLTSFIFNPISFAAGSINTFNSNAAGLVIPTNGSFWAGMSFDNNNGTSGATAAQLNNLGQGIFNPPTVGSSQDLFFQSSAPTYGTSSPAGTFSNFGGAPVANFGWRFQVAAPAAVPEPGAGVFLLVGGLSLALLTFSARSRRRLA